MHQLKTLARGSGTSVCRCSCGSIHLKIGTLTLQLDPQQLHSLSKTLRLAVAADRFGETQAPAQLHS